MSSQTIAQWVSAIGSAGSLLGFAAYVWIMLLNRKDQQSVRQEQQAQGVTAWLDEGAHHDRDEDYVLVAHNGGDSPVFQVRCLFSLPSSDDQHAVELSLLPPRHDAVRSLPFSADEVSVDELYSAPAVPEMRFTDSHGTHWGRDGAGQLYRVDARSVRRRPHARADHGSSSRDDRDWEAAHRHRAGASGSAEEHTDDSGRENSDRENSGDENSDRGNSDRGNSDRGNSGHESSGQRARATSKAG